MTTGTFNTTPVTLLIRGRLPESALTQLRDLAESLGGLLEDCTAPLLTTDQARVLAALRSADRQLTSGDVTQLTGISRGSARCHLARLVRAGLASRQWGTRGNSETLFAVTEAGRLSAD
jgi:DNA-binding MarR family transcriptional regulator